RSRPVWRGHIVNVARRCSHPEGWARPLTALKGSASPGPGFSLGTGAAMGRRKFIGTVGAGLGAVFVPRWPARGEVLVERWSWAMGQAVHLMVYAESEQAGLDACAAALAELRRVEARLTLFDDASDLCELNRTAGRGALRVDRDLGAVLALAARFKRATGGAFNVAVEPLMRAWGFHRPRAGPPTPSQPSAAREAVATAVAPLAADVGGVASARDELGVGAT